MLRFFELCYAVFKKKTLRIKVLNVFQVNIKVSLTTSVDVFVVHLLLTLEKINVTVTTLS